MKQSTLLNGIENDIKIEKGLKVIEFATQFYMRRAYFRNCPLTMSEEKSKLGSSSFEPEILAELNELLATSGTEGKANNISVTNNELFSVSDSKQFSGVDLKQNSSQQLAKDKLKDQNYSQNNQLERISSQRQALPSNMSKSFMLKKSESLKPGAPKSVDTKILSKPKDSLLKKNNIQQSEVRVQISNLDSDQSGLPSQLSEQSHDIVDEEDNALDWNDFPSHHSEVRNLAVIEEKSIEDSIRIPQTYIQSGQYSRRYNLSDFNSIREQISIGNSTQQKYPERLARPEKITKQCQFPSILSINMSKEHSQTSKSSLSFLNKSISLIRPSQNSSISRGTENDETYEKILREMSDSFTDTQTMQRLLKLQNFQLQEKFLLDKMEKRFNSCRKTIDDMRKISWNSLGIPKADLRIRKPNYAQCYDALQ